MRERRLVRCRQGPPPQRVRRYEMKTMFLICLACLGLAGPAVAQAGTKPPPVLGGTAVVGVENAPPCLDPLARSCNTLATAWMTESTLLGAYRVLPDLTYEPVLVDRVDLVRRPTAKRAFSVTY